MATKKIKKETNLAKVGVIMGSDSDLPIMKQAAEMLVYFGITFEVTIVSAHRTPLRMFEYAKTAAQRGIKIIIAGAGGAAHLPGMIAAITTLPVIGVPIKSSNSLDGWDSILSILAAQIIALQYPTILEKIETYRQENNAKVEKAIKLTAKIWPNEYDK